MALAAGPVVGGLLIDRFGWQSVFFLNVPIGVIAFVVCIFAVHESKSPEGRHLDLPGQVLAFIGLGTLTYALIEANNYGWTSALILTLFAVAVVGLTAFVLVERRSTSPMLQLGFFRTGTFTAGASCSAAVSFGMFGMFFFMSLQTGLRALPLTVMIIIVAPLAGRLASRIGSRVPMAVGLSINAVSLFLFIQVQVHTPYAHIWPLLSLAGLGMGMVMSPMTAAVMSTVRVRCTRPCSLPPSDRQTATTRPSGDGTYQSMAVVPLVLYALGSNTVRHSAGAASEDRRTSTGCCAGGLKRNAKMRPFRSTKPE